MKYIYDIFGGEYNRTLGYPAAGIALGSKLENHPQPQEDFCCIPDKCLDGKK